MKTNSVNEEEVWLEQVLIPDIRGLITVYRKYGMCDEARHYIEEIDKAAKKRLEKVRSSRKIAVKISNPMGMNGANAIVSPTVMHPDDEYDDIDSYW